MTINDKVYPKMTPEKAEEVIDEIRREEESQEIALTVEGGEF